MLQNLKMSQVFFLVAMAAAAFCPSLAVYNVGVGIADITGPAAEVNMVR